MALAAGVGCGEKRTALQRDFARGVDQVQHTHDWHVLDRQLTMTLKSIRADSDGRARRVALEGFAAMRVSAEAQIEFEDFDTGNLPVATVDATRAYRFGLRGAKLLRIAGRLLDVPVADVRGL